MQTVKLLVEGNYACFTRPEMKFDRISYDVMTPSAARGILESVHWTPAIKWVVDEIHILKPIRFQAVQRNDEAGKPPERPQPPLAGPEQPAHQRQGSNRNRPSRLSTVLTDVGYVICAHFTLTPKAGPSDSAAQHLDIFRRRARKGQCFQQPCLGTREFPAVFRLVENTEPEPPTIDETGDLGFMLYDIDYTTSRTSLFFRAKLDKGVLRVPSPGSRELCA